HHNIRYFTFRNKIMARLEIISDTEIANKITLVKDLQAEVKILIDLQIELNKELQRTKYLKSQNK
ncbi:MAG TPA: hypothetical protein VNX01_06160, partial [Bacteroidia bacterium]|nr:hypothetical protein [Bacteroidia bacterium]